MNIHTNKYSLSVLLTCNSTKPVYTYYPVGQILRLKLSITKQLWTRPVWFHMKSYRHEILDLDTSLKCPSYWSLPCNFFHSLVQYHNAAVFLWKLAADILSVDHACITYVAILLSGFCHSSSYEMVITNFDPLQKCLLIALQDAFVLKISAWF